MEGAGQRSSGPSGCGHRVALSRCSRDASRRELCSAGSISGQSRLVAGKASVYGSDVYVGGYTGMIKSRGISPRNDQSRDLEPARHPPTQPRSPPAYPPPSSLAYTDKKKSAGGCTKMLPKGMCMLNGKRVRAGERRAAPTGSTSRRERRDEAADTLSRVLGARTGAGRRLASKRERVALLPEEREGGCAGQGWAMGSSGRVSWLPRWQQLTCERE